MRTYTVKQVAMMAGVSVRTLHHYDQMGLLSPAFVGENNYRYYTRDELVGLQEIQFFKRMGLSLAQIRTAQGKPDNERAQMLECHKVRLEQEARRQLQLIKTIDRTIAELNGEKKMNLKELYEGFSEEKQKGFEQELINQYGKAMKEDIAAAQYKLERDANGGTNSRIKLPTSAYRKCIRLTQTSKIVLRRWHLV